MKKPTTKQSDEHIRRIDGVLSRVFRRNGYEAVEYRCPLSELLEGERDPEMDEADERAERERALVSEARQATLINMLEYVFADGPHPGCSMRRLYSLARAFRPLLIAEMNGTDLAEMFDETRAAQSWRCKQMFEGYMTARGAHSGKMYFNKGSEAKHKYSVAQKGNQNRKGKSGKKAHTT